MIKALIILGPTATRKTDLGIRLAKKFNGELISCDSRQVYTGLDIGTGKYPGGGWRLEVGGWKKGKGFWEVDGVKIWMYDVVSPKKQYTVYDYVKDANRVIYNMVARNKLPIVVGGTGLYLKALISGLPNLAIPVDKKLRKKLEELTKKQLQKKLKKVSADRWKSLNQSDRENPRRLVRAIELELNNEVEKDQGYLGFSGKTELLKIGLTTSRGILYKRAAERVVSRMDQGMIEEAKRLHKAGLSLKRMRQLGLEYGVLADYLEGKIREFEGDRGLIKLMQGKVHGFVRRQLTWFRKEKDIFWFNITEKQYLSKIEKKVGIWYDTLSTNAAKNRHFP